MDTKISQSLKASMDETDALLTEARAELAALREKGLRKDADFAQQIRDLHSEHDAVKASLHKTSNQLNLSVYRDAMLQAQPSVVPPYVLTREAVLCHAVHRHELATKQVRFMQRHHMELVWHLENSERRYDEFWEPRLWGLRREIQEATTDIEDVTMRMQAVEQISEELEDCVLLLHQSPKFYSHVEPCQHAAMLSVLSMAIALRRFHGVNSLGGSHRKQAPSFQPYAPKRMPLEIIREEQPMAKTGFVQRRS